MANSGDFSGAIKSTFSWCTCKYARTPLGARAETKRLPSQLDRAWRREVSPAIVLSGSAQQASTTVPAPRAGDALSAPGSTGRIGPWLCRPTPVSWRAVAFSDVSPSDLPHVDAHETSEDNYAAQVDSVKRVAERCAPLPMAFQPCGNPGLKFRRKSELPGRP